LNPSEYFSLVLHALAVNFSSAVLAALKNKMHAMTQTTAACL